VASSFAGSFLVARPVIQDPNFRRSVVLLIQHGEGGAFGLVVNRPAKVEGVPFTVYAGGPCQSPGLLMLHGHREWASEDEDQPSPELAPGIFLGDAHSVRRISDDPTEDGLRFRMFVGYAGWGPGQLEEELASGSWAVVAASGQVLFESAVENVWKDLLPPMLPQPSLN
jgi:putative transcriptional regulator